MTKRATSRMKKKLRFDLAELPPGDFVMGRTKSVLVDELAVRMKLTKPVRIMTTLVTQGMWLKIMETPIWRSIRSIAEFREGADFPVVGVDWYDACKFARELSKATGDYYRLPTEVEWEYAIRAGSKSEYFWGDNIEDCSEFAWCHDNSLADEDVHLHEVATLKPNPWGLYDMAGNAKEWVLDLCRAGNMSVDVNADHFPEKGVDFVSMAGWKGIVRNASFASDCVETRSTARDPIDLNTRNVQVGFRLVLDTHRLVDVDKFEVLELPYSENPGYLPINVFWDQIDNPPSRRSDHVGVFSKYLRQLSNLERKERSLLELDRQLLEEMRAAENLKRLLRAALAVRSMYVKFHGDVSRSIFGKLGAAIESIKSRLED